MNILDRAVGLFSPAAGLRRATARAQTAIVMNYDAASRGRRTYGWKAPATAADAAAFGSRARLRQLSRDMMRNRAYAARARDVVVANVVGEGIAPSIRSSSANAKATVEELLKRHLLSNDIDTLGEYDLFEMQQICMSTVFTDGEVLLRRRMRSPRFQGNLALPYQVELLEADCLDMAIQSHGDNLVFEGVEYGPTGAVEAYHFLPEHPGAIRHSKPQESTRVHWSDVIHIRRFERPGQLRGVPWLAPVMMTLGELSDYQEAQILKQRMSALLAIMLKWAVGSTRSTKAGAGLEALEPGAIVELPEGAEPVSTNPPTVEGYGEFMETGLRTIAAGLGITYEALTGDLRRTNFSSGRLGRNEMDRLVRMWQRGLMIAQFGAGMERWFREGLALVGHRGIDFTIDWTPPRRILVDPTKEIPAMIEEVDAGLNSRQGVQRELGRDPDRIREERLADQQADAAAGLKPPAEQESKANAAEPTDTEDKPDADRG
ncbi:phage portal protein [Paracoccus sp. CPCC 101403]|uniref:Phage portal protein n=1 Tax=Paracoccus broussonetiae TaxID=3075834 RepID=A0ABU3EEP2_9RHOB|nr:phage portal protein [Paracoccus sp. CPCC 101403]MDT1061895.1 phage portal protein [Paracoccus sp. CPCC 101403]